MEPDTFRTSYGTYRDLLDAETNPATLNLSDTPRLATYQKGWISNEDNAFVWGPNTFIGNIDCSSTQMLHQWNFGTLINEASSKVNCLLELKGMNSYKSLLLLGLAYGQEGLICLLSCEGSVVIGAITFPSPVKSMCIVNAGVPGGQNLNIHSELSNTSGLIAVGLLNGDVLLLDLRRDDEATWMAKEGVEPSSIVTCGVLKAVQVEHCRSFVKSQINHHLAFELFDNKHRPENRSSVTSLVFSPQMNSLIVGVEAGFFEIWNLLTITLEQTSETVLGAFTHLVLQHPEDDPNPVFYVWAVEQTPKSLPRGFMYCIRCEDRDATAEFGIQYKKVQSVTRVHEFTMMNDDFLTGIGKCLSAYIVQNPSTVVTPGRSLEPSDESETLEQTESLVAQNDNLCSFTWLMWDERTGTSSRGLALFDLSVWYQHQMPEKTTFVSVLFQKNFCLAFTFLKQLDDYPDDTLLDARIIAKSIKKFSSVTSPEESSYPSSLTFDITCLLKHSIFRLRHVGVQSYELQKLDQLDPLQLATPYQLERDFMEAHLKPMCDKHTPLSGAEYVMSLALEHGFDGFLKRCATSWAEGEHAAAGLTLSFFMDWSWKIAKITKGAVEELVLHLYNGSGTDLTKQSYRLLSHCKLQFSGIQNLLQYLLDQGLVESPQAVQETTERVHALELLSLYTDTILCLAKSNLLPEPTPKQKGKSKYPVKEFVTECQERRRTQCYKGQLLVDVLIESCSNELQQLWHNKGGSGCYPPPSIRAFLHTYLLASVPTDLKHQIGAYYRMELAALIEKHKPMAIHVERLRAYPSTNPSRVKLAQALWYLDHSDFKNACSILENPMIEATDLQLWKGHILSCLALSGELGLAAHLLSQRSSEESTIETLNIEIEIWLNHGRILEAFCSLKKLLKLESKEAKEIEGDHIRINDFFEDVISRGYVKNLMEQPMINSEQNVLRDILDRENPNLCYVYLLVKNRMSEAQKYLNQRNISKTLRILCQQLDCNLGEVITQILQNEPMALTFRGDRGEGHVNPKTNEDDPTTSSSLVQSGSSKYPMCEAYASSAHTEIEDAVAAMALILTSKEALDILKSPALETLNESPEATSDSSTKDSPPPPTTTTTTACHSILKQPSTRQTSDKAQLSGKDSSAGRDAGAGCSKQLRFNLESEDETDDSTASTTTNPDKKHPPVPSSSASESSSPSSDERPGLFRQRQGQFKHPGKTSSQLAPTARFVAQHTGQTKDEQGQFELGSPQYSPSSPPTRKPSPPSQSPTTRFVPEVLLQHPEQTQDEQGQFELGSPQYSPSSPPTRKSFPPSQLSPTSRFVPEKLLQRPEQTRDRQADRQAQFQLGSPQYRPPTDNNPSVARRADSSSLVSTSDNQSSSKVSPTKSSPTKNTKPAVVSCDSMQDATQQKVSGTKGALVDSSKIPQDPEQNRDLGQQKVSDNDNLKVDGSTEICDSTSNSSGTLHQKGGAELDIPSHSTHTDTKEVPSPEKNSEPSASCDTKTEIQSIHGDRENKDVGCAAFKPDEDDDSQATVIAPHCSPTNKKGSPLHSRVVNDNSSDDCIVLDSTDDESPVGAKRDADTPKKCEDKVSEKKKSDNETSNSSEESSDDSDMEEESSSESEEEIINNSVSDDDPSSGSAVYEDSSDEETESDKPNDIDSNREASIDSKAHESPDDDEPNKETEPTNRAALDSDDGASENKETTENKKEPESTSVDTCSKTEAAETVNTCDSAVNTTQEALVSESHTSDLDITLHYTESQDSNDAVAATSTEKPSQLDTTIQAEPPINDPQEGATPSQDNVPASTIKKHDQGSNENYEVLGSRRMTRSQLKLRSQHCPLPIPTESKEMSPAPGKSTDDEPPRKVRRSSRISSTKRDHSSDSTSRASLPKRTKRRDSETGDDNKSVVSEGSCTSKVSESSSHYATRSVTAQLGREDLVQLTFSPGSRSLRRQSASSTSTVRSTKSISEDN